MRSSNPTHLLIAQPSPSTISTKKNLHAGTHRPLLHILLLKHPTPELVLKAASCHIAQNNKTQIRKAPPQHALLHILSPDSTNSSVQVSSDSATNSCCTRSARSTQEGKDSRKPLAQSNHCMWLTSGDSDQQRILLASTTDTMYVTAYSSYPPSRQTRALSS